MNRVPDPTDDAVRSRVAAAVAGGDTEALNLVLDALARAGRAELLVEVVQRHGLARPAVARVVTADADIDDAEQMTLVKVHLGLATFRGDSSFRTWLYSVARNEALMLLRHNASRLQAPPAGAHPEDAPATGFARSMSSQVASRADLERAIAELEEPFRTAVTLRDVDGLSYDEIAARTGVAAGTVASRIARGRALLMAVLLQA